MAQIPEIDRLIEDGLARYGRGDLDGALGVWEQALAIDPDNAQANSYVDYVRANYELLTSEVAGTEPAPFAISAGEPDYQIEVAPGELVPGTPAAITPDVDGGWALEDELTVSRGGPRGVAEPRTVSTLDLELEAEEPPDATGEISFDDATREYDSAARAVSEFSNDFQTPTGGFSMEDTGVRPRELGFVKATEPPPMGPKSTSTIPGMQIAPTGASTRELPGKTRPPASAEVTPSTPSPTRDFGAQVTTDLKLTDLQYEVLTPAQREMPTGKMPALVRPPAPLAEMPLISQPTRDIGTRPAPAPSEDDDTQRVRIDHLDSLATGVHQPLERPDPDVVDALAGLDAEAPAHESKEDRTRRRIMALFERAASWSRSGAVSRAVAAVELAMSEDPNSALAQKLIHRNRDTIMFVFQAYLGDMGRTPVLARPLHELASAPISPRAAFLLSRIDSMLTLEEVLDVSGMPRVEAYRYLCQLYQKGILR